VSVGAFKPVLNRSFIMRCRVLLISAVSGTRRWHILLFFLDVPTPPSVADLPSACIVADHRLRIRPDLPFQNS